MIKKLILIALLACSFNLQAFELISDNSGHDNARAHKFNFSFPDMTLVDHRNQSVELGRFFAHEDTVVFAFFFTHCVSVCTTLTHTLKNLQPRLPEGTKIAMISIDPETDTPDLLRDYVSKHQIDDRNWYLLTGENRNIIDLQKNFEAYRGNKMNHSVSLFLKQSDSEVITEIKRDFARIPGLLARG